MNRKKKTALWAGVTGGLVATSLISFVIYRYRKHKAEEKYFDNVTEADIAWG